MNSVVSTAAAVARDEVSRARLVSPHRDVLLASDASPAALAATRIVSALASRWSMTRRVVTVVPPPSVAFNPVGVTVAFGAGHEEELAREVRSQLVAASVGAAVWSHEMRAGSPAAEI